MAHRSWPFNGTLLILQLALGLLLIAQRPRPSTAGQIVFWLTVYVLFSILLQVVAVRYWKRHPREDPNLRR